MTLIYTSQAQTLITCYRFNLYQGDFHDKEERIKKDEIKNMLFLLGGLDLLRIHPRGQEMEDEIRQEIGKRVQDWKRVF